jgi:hypothetical protein
LSIIPTYRRFTNNTSHIFIPYYIYYCPSNHSP